MSPLRVLAFDRQQLAIKVAAGGVGLICLALLAQRMLRMESNHALPERR